MNAYVLLMRDGDGGEGSVVAGVFASEELAEEFAMEEHPSEYSEGEYQIECHELQGFVDPDSESPSYEEAGYENEADEDAACPYCGDDASECPCNPEWE